MCICGTILHFCMNFIFYLIQYEIGEPKPHEARMCAIYTDNEKNRYGHWILFMVC